jgi:hypothetical protein
MDNSKKGLKPPTSALSRKWAVYPQKMGQFE